MPVEVAQFFLKPQVAAIAAAVLVAGLVGIAPGQVFVAVLVAGSAAFPRVWRPGCGCRSAGRWRARPTGHWMPWWPWGWRELLSLPRLSGAQIHDPDPATTVLASRRQAHQTRAASGPSTKLLHTGAVSPDAVFGSSGRVLGRPAYDMGTPAPALPPQAAGHARSGLGLELRASLELRLRLGSRNHLRHATLADRGVLTDAQLKVPVSAPRDRDAIAVLGLEVAPSARLHG